MYPITQAYREQMEKPLRNASHVKIVFGVTDPDAPSASTPVDNGHLPFSDVNSVDLGLSVATPYQTLEKNRFILDGKSPMAPSSNFVYQGFVSKAISDDAGVFSVPPVVTVSFNEFVQFAALTLYFDTIMNEYPTEFTVQCYYNSTSVLSKTYVATSSEFVSNDAIPLCNKIVITFKKTYRPHRRLRLSQIIYGVISTLTAADLVSCSQSASMDIISSNLPDEKFSFTIMDVERRYDPENPQGVWEYLESRQPVNVSIGYELDSGDIEWFPWCNTYSTGDVKVNKGGVVAEVTIETESLIQQLTKTYTRGVYRPAGVSLATLAEEVMTFVGYPNILVMDDSLRSLTTTIPLPEVEANQCLQLIANAGMCVLVTDRSGSPMMIKVTEEDEIQDFTMSKKQAKEEPTVTKYPVLRNLITGYSHINVGSEVQNLIENVQITGANRTSVELTYSSATNQSVQISSGLTLHSATHYAQRSVLVLTGTGTVTITGNALETQDVGYTKIVHEVGEDLEITNELISSYEHAKQYADWVAGCEERRIEYAITDRGYPELDLGDTVNVVSNFDNTVPATIMKKSLTFNGTISGSATYLARK